MANPIVQVNVSQVVAPTPNNLQKKGAAISQGGTTIGAGNSQLLTSLADLTAILVPAKAITSLAWSGGTVTVTTAAPHGIANATVFPVVIAGAAPVAYNGHFTATVTGASTFTYPLVSDPGAETTPGTYQSESAYELLAMGTTFFAQGSSQALYVLELDYGDASVGVTALDTYITDNPQDFYSYLVPRYWDANADFLTFVATFESNTSKTYFFVTTTLANYSNYTAAMKSVIWLVEAPDIPNTEFSIAAAFYVSLNYAPASANKVTPFAYSFLFGVTSYPTKGNNAVLAAILTANGNYVGVASEGGISNSMLQAGTTADGNDFTYWYSIDWVQINVDLNVSNAVINGSNNPANPLYFNQDGIDRLQAVAASTMGSGVSFGLVLGQVTQTELTQDAFNQAQNLGQFNGQTIVNAIPFIPYNQANPTDFKAGTYRGFTILYTPNRGFKQIIFNVIVTQFVSAAQ